MSMETKVEMQEAMARAGGHLGEVASGIRRGLADAVDAHRD